MTEQYMDWDGKEASDLHGIGKYGSDSYQIFFFNHIPPNVQDKELKKFVHNILVIIKKEEIGKNEKCN